MREGVSDISAIGIKSQLPTNRAKLDSAFFFYPHSAIDSKGCCQWYAMLGYRNGERR